MSALQQLAEAPTPVPKRSVVVASPLSRQQQQHHQQNMVSQQSPSPNAHQQQHRLMPLPGSPQNIALFSSAHRGVMSQQQQQPSSQQSPLVQQQHQQVEAAVTDEVERRLSEERMQRDRDEEQFLLELNQHIEQLNVENGQLTADKKKLQDTVSGFEKEKAELMAHHRTLVSSVTELTDQVEKEREKVAKLEVSLAHAEDKAKSESIEAARTLRRAEEDAKQDHTSRLDAMSKLENLKHDCQKRLFEQEEKNSQLRAELDTVMKESKNHQQTVEKLKMLLQAAKSELQNSQEVIESESKTVQDDQKTLRSAQLRVKDLQASLKAAEDTKSSKVEELEAKVKHQTDEVRKKNHRLQNAEKELTGVREALSHSISEYQTAKSKLEQISSSVEDLASSCSKSKELSGSNPLHCLKVVEHAFTTASDAKKNLTQQVKQLTAEVDKLQTELQQAGKQDESSRAKIRDLENHLAEMSRSVQSKEFTAAQDASRLRRELEDVTSEHSSCKSQLETTLAEMNRLSFQYDEAQGTVETMTKELKEAHEAVREQKRKYAKIKEGEMDFLEVIKALRKELRECQKESTSATQDRAAALKLSEEASDMKTKLHRRTIKLAEDLKKKTTECSDAVAELTKVKETCRDLEQRLNQRRGEEKNRAARAKTLEEDLLESKTETSRLQQLNDSFQVQIQTLTEKMKNTENRGLMELETARQETAEVSDWCYSWLTGSLNTLIQILQGGSPARRSISDGRGIVEMLRRVDEDISFCLELGRGLARKATNLGQETERLRLHCAAEKERASFLSNELDSYRDSMMTTSQQQQQQVQVFSPVSVSSKKNHSHHSQHTISLSPQPAPKTPTPAAASSSPSARTLSATLAKEKILQSSTARKERSTSRSLSRDYIPVDATGSRGLSTSTSAHHVDPHHRSASLSPSPLSSSKTTPMLTFGAAGLHPSSSSRQMGATTIAPAATTSYSANLGSNHNHRALPPQGQPDLRVPSLRGGSM